MSFSTFVPVLLTRRGLSLAQAGTAVSIYLIAVGLGGFIGGPSADRFGPRRVIILSLVSSVPFLMIAPMLHGWLFVIVLAIGGFLLQSTLPVNVTFAQLIAPISAATVSSLMMGFAWGTGGLSVPLVGMMADRFGIERALIVMSALPLVAAPAGGSASVAKTAACCGARIGRDHCRRDRHRCCRLGTSWHRLGVMRGRYPGPSDVAYSFGPGKLTPAVKAIMIANVAVFVLTYFAPALIVQLGLRPADLFGQFAVWQLVTYMFVHAGVSHIFFNMLTLWFVGVELERMWGTTVFHEVLLRVGLGAGLTQVLLGILPLPFASQFYYPSTVGASGRDLRVADGVRAVLPDPAVPRVLRLPGPGPLLRDDPRRHCRCSSPWEAVRESPTRRTWAVSSPGISI